MIVLQKKLVICLLGPTASGKTDLALQMAKDFPVELISVDSAMIYRGMDIGTAKPNIALQKEYPHKLIDICYPQEVYSVADFFHDCQKAINKAHAASKIPVCVGGTMMYFNALMHGLSILPKADAAIRSEILIKAEKEGWGKLYEELQSVDSITAAKLHPNDPQRLQRALEIYKLTGKPLSSLLAEKITLNADYDFCGIVLAPEDRKILHERIENRFDVMLEEGFIEEVETLKKLPGISADLPSMRSVGYRQIWDYLDNKYDKETMRDKAIAASRQLAKRQLTWLRNWSSDLKWLQTDNINIEKELKKILASLNIIQ